MANGKVKWFNPTKGFGFVEPQEGGNDIFIHISAVEAAGLSGLEDNQEISYDLEDDGKGRSSATNIELV